MDDDLSSQGSYMVKISSSQVNEDSMSSGTFMQVKSVVADDVFSNKSSVMFRHLVSSEGGLSSGNDSFIRRESNDEIFIKLSDTSQDQLDKEPV